MQFLTVILVISINILSAQASDGDRSPYHQNCVNTFRELNCAEDGVSFKDKAVDRQDVINKLLLWGCLDEGRYKCMWKTVEGFQQKGYSIPKFHGKWPFIRFLGMQEPASVFSSILNLLGHWYGFKQLRKRRSHFLPGLVNFWTLFALVCIQAWVWSAVFHARDTPFTEFMDYACALSMVMGLFIAAIVRIPQPKSMSRAGLLSAPFIIYYWLHVRYLYGGVIDYDYNLNCNIFIGTLAIGAWISWALYRYVHGTDHVRPMLAFTALSALTLTLELMDFPPYFYVWDAHALWHLSTSILPVLFYRFVLDDLDELASERYSEKIVKESTKSA